MSAQCHYAQGHYAECSGAMECLWQFSPSIDCNMLHRSVNRCSSPLVTETVVQRRFKCTVAPPIESAQCLAGFEAIDVNVVSSFDCILPCLRWSGQGILT